jgi:hypothetical protein
MVAAIVFLISAISLRNFSLYYWRSMSATISGSAPGLYLD